MPRSREYLRKRVQARVDEFIPSGQNVGGQTAIEAPMETIDSELDFSALYVLRTANEDLVLPAVIGDLKHFHGTSVEDIDTRIIIDSSSKKATVVLPDNFARFISMRLSGWKTDLKRLMLTSDPSYRMQEYNRFTSGSIEKPKGYLVSFVSYTDGTGDTDDEKTKWDINQTLTANQTLSSLYNGQTPSGGTILSTGNIIALSGQSDDDENGIYLVKASGAPTKLSDETSNANVNCKQAIEVYRASSSSDTIDHLHYIPKLKAEEMPDELIDALIEHCAGRVFSQMGNIAGREASFKQAEYLLTNLNTGLIGEN